MPCDEPSAFSDLFRPRCAYRQSAHSGVAWLSVFTCLAAPVAERQVLMDSFIVNQGRWHQRVWLGAAVALALAALTAWSSLRLRGAVASLDAEVTALEHAAASTQPGAAASNPADFILQLPPTASADAFVNHLQRSAAQSGVVVQLVTAKASTATPQSLGRVDLSISLRGAYGPLKDVLAQALALRGVVLQRLVLRRHTLPTDVEGQVDLTLLSQPSRAISN